MAAKVFEFHYYVNGRFYLVVPEVLYFALLFGGMLPALFAVGACVWGVIRKRQRRFFAAWIAALLVSVISEALLLNGIIVANTMLGG